MLAGGRVGSVESTEGKGSQHYEMRAHDLSGWNPWGDVLALLSLLQSQDHRWRGGDTCPESLVLKSG